MTVKTLTSQIHFQTSFLRMRGKPNSWLPLAEGHVVKRCLKVTLQAKNSTFRHSASNVAEGDESEGV